MVLTDVQRDTRVFYLSCRQGLAAACCLLFYLLPANVAAQSGDDLKTLFFDPVYMTGDDEILLSSGSRPGIQNLPPTIARPDPPSRLAADLINDIENYRDNINLQIEQDGIFNQQLAQEYLALGDAQTLAGDVEAATAAYENAMYVERVNAGLYTLSQADAVRKLIDINKATRNLGEADKYHQYLYYLLSRNYDKDSDALREATVEWADWNMEAFRRMAFSREEGLSVSGDIGSVPSSMLRRGEMVAIVDNISSEVLFVPRSTLFSNPGNVRMHAYTADQMMDPRLKNAEDLYDKLLEDNDPDPGVWKKKANLLYLFKYQLENYIGIADFSSPLINTSTNLVRSVPMLRRGYADSRENLEAAATALEETQPREAARLYIDIGDWEALFDRNQGAANAYAKAWELLGASGMSDAEIGAFINPEPALIIPEYISYEYTRRFQNIPESLDVPYIGYIDVVFNKNASGSLRSVDIVNASENTSTAVRTRLRDMLREVKVRPYIQGGERQEQNDIKVRYYYSY